ncbi:MAG: hypothetical protein O2955_16840 [Planctomycetota bacterium]|nr:hypothetical protein [Planctomycetota bacterium]MDA1214181.1 hypothetical protein [Planctomycetota bacterium]
MKNLTQILLAVALVSLSTIRTTAEEIKKLAAVVTVYHTNSHADVIIGRVVLGNQLDGSEPWPGLEIVSLYADQKVDNDPGVALCEQHNIRQSQSIADALTLGTGELAVDGVLMIGEHGRYPDSVYGQTEFPKKRFWTEIVSVFEKSGRVVPVFSDKHLSHDGPEGREFYDAMKRLNVPFMAGSSISSAWRVPEINTSPDKKLLKIYSIGYGGHEPYGFHSLEQLQCLAEHRPGGETGLKSVRGLKGEQVWQAGRDGVFDIDVINAALAAQPKTETVTWDKLPTLVAEPAVMILEYEDGLQGAMFMLNGAVAEFTTGWRDEAGVQGVWSKLEENRPFRHFGVLLEGISHLMHTGKPAWPVERTLLTTGALHGGFLSWANGGEPVDVTAWNVPYQSEWTWKMPGVFPE